MVGTGTTSRGDKHAFGKDLFSLHITVFQTLMVFTISVKCPGVSLFSV